MKRVSQRTLVRMMEILALMQQAARPRRERGVYTVAGGAEKEFWRRLLIEHSFPQWFVAKAEQSYGFYWDTILLHMRDGSFFRAYDSFLSDVSITGEFLSPEEERAWGEILIQRLAALITSQPEGEKVLRSLELDGFAVNLERLELVPLEGPVSQKEEEDRLLKLVRSAGLPGEALILKHITDARTLYEDGRDHPALGESRNFLQAIIDDISSETSKSGTHSFGLPSGTANRLEYLRNTGFLTPDEEAALKAAWGALSSGSHPGLPAREEARIGLILAIEFGQVLLLKFKDWKANNYARFSHA